MVDRPEKNVKSATPRKGMPSVRLDEEQFKRRFGERFQDPAFARLQRELEAIAAAAFDAYEHSRKSPHTRKAGPEFEDPAYDLSMDWLNARDALRAAQRGHDDPKGTGRILLINGSPRNDHTCPGEMSKSWRLAELAQETFAGEFGMKVELLDLSRITAEYGRNIHPCKACFSTSPALCHWPCSCYPNHSLGQTQDWMNEIYPLWVAAHGIMIITPVHWYQVPSPLKLMMDRLVCADGGNPDPTRTQGKDAKRAQEIELAGWDYPRHLAGRHFAVVVHGDAEGAETVRRSLADWLSSMKLRSVGPMGELDRYIGYWKPYAAGHAELDVDTALQEEVRNAARFLAEAVTLDRAGRLPELGKSLVPPREK